METAERRRQIMLLLCRRRHETIQNMAFEFGVSERTIRRDIEALSAVEPIYTQTGRYGGGVYVTDGYAVDRLYLSADEIGLLKKVDRLASEKKLCFLTPAEAGLLKKMIGKYTKPIAVH